MVIKVLLVKMVRMVAQDLRVIKVNLDLILNMSMLLLTQLLETK